MNTEQKLNILADSSKFDLACACKTGTEPGRIRGTQGRWIYPAVLPSGRKVFLLKTLQTNACVNDCSYCPFNLQRDFPRCTLSPDELARGFMQLLDANRVSGLFLSSGVIVSPDATMEKMLATVELLRRRYQFRGFIHLKVLPGSSPTAIEQAVRLATRVSVNIEAPNASRLRQLSRKKRFYEDIVSTMENIARLRRQINPNCKQTTQFVVGAAGESDREIVLTTARMYQKFHMERVYFSAFQNFDTYSGPTQNLLFDDSPQPRTRIGPTDSFIREHRLYQVDFLLRRYGFSPEDIHFDDNRNLSLHYDPKLIWARRHPEFFPIDPNRADKWQLLRVPGIGPLGAQRILNACKHQKIHHPEQLAALGIKSPKAWPYLSFGRLNR